MWSPKLRRFFLRCALPAFAANSEFDNAVLWFESPGHPVLTKLPFVRASTGKVHRQVPTEEVADAIRQYVRRLSVDHRYETLSHLRDDQRQQTRTRFGNRADQPLPDSLSKGC